MDLSINHGANLFVHHGLNLTSLKMCTGAANKNIPNTLRIVFFKIKVVRSKQELIFQNSNLFSVTKTLKDTLKLHPNKQA